MTKIVNLRIDDVLRTWLLFGEPLESHHTDARSIHLFESDAFLGLSRQSLNPYGIVRWEMYLLRTVAAGERYQQIPQVRPGAELLAYASGKAHAEAFQQYARLLEDHGLDAGRVGSLHRRAAPVLQLGKVPTDIVRQYVEEKTGEDDE